MMLDGSENGTSETPLVMTKIRCSQSILRPDVTRAVGRSTYMQVGTILDYLAV
jgi:hypothetical protein